MVTKTVEVNGVRLSYSESGIGPTVVLSHGVIQDYRTWEELAKELSTSFHVISYSRRCSCPNGDRKYEDSTVENNAMDLAGLITATGGGPVDLVGQSYGGEVAAVCTLMHPELVRNLVLVEPMLLGVLIEDPLRSSQRMSLLFRKPSAAISSMRFERRGLNAAIRELDLENEEMALRLFVDGLRGRQGSLEKYPEDMRTMMRENVGTIRESVTKAPHFTREEAKRIAHPTLLIKGGRTIGMFSAIIDELHKALPNSQVVIIPDAAHIVHLENPGECNRAIVKFLKEHDQ